ncbi:GNAT family N-acetyltransferase [Chitinophagaceae bacterium MMS25-I14]
MTHDEAYKVVNNEREQQLEIHLDDGLIAYLTYRFYKKDIALMHTFVPKPWEGKGLASTLARAAFNYAVALDKPVMVYCPFVSRFLKNHTEYRMFLDPEYHKG